MSFEFSTAARVLFGPGRYREIPALAGSLGTRPLLVAGQQELASDLSSRLASSGLHWEFFLVDKEPDLESVMVATRKARDSDCDLVLGLGGGSALDTGKAVAALLTNPGEALSYLETVGAGRTLENPSCPFIAVPTTAGTGSEVTRNAVLSIPEAGLKASLRSPFLLPRLAVVDPELTYGLPADLTASTGLDALTHLIEPFTCSAPTPLTDALCQDGIPRAARALPRAVAEPRDPAARQDMSLASLYGGMALANARLGAVHGLAAVLGGRYPAPHGAVCARLLPYVMTANLRALHERAPNSPILARYMEIARLLTGNPSARSESGPAWIRAQSRRFFIRPLGDYGLTRFDFAEIARLAQNSSSMKGNPIPLTDPELEAVLQEAL